MWASLNAIDDLSLVLRLGRLAAVLVLPSGTPAAHSLGVIHGYPLLIHCSDIAVVASTGSMLCGLVSARSCSGERIVTMACSP